MYRSITSTLGPLLVSSMSRVDALVVSMEGRAFGHGKERTFLRTVPWRGVDLAVVVTGAVLPVLAVLSRWDLI
jgi:energy-coupling factor transport system permease protein